ncbi:metalloproteinase, extracellular matrix protein Lsg2, partial [Volvox carteri f. nagariensis]
MRRQQMVASAICRPAHFVLATLLALTNVARAEVGGVAQVMSALEEGYFDSPPGVPNFHLNNNNKDYLYLADIENPSGSAWRLVAEGPNLIDKYNVSTVLTGDYVRVNYKNSSTASGSRRLLSDEPLPEIDSIDVISESEGHEIYTGTQIRVKSMIYIISTCGWAPSATVEFCPNFLLQQIKGTFFNNTNNIAGYHDTCSYGKVAFDPSENFVFGPVEVQIPCKGTVTNGVLKYPYDASVACGAAEQFAWRQYSEAAARA